MVSLSRLTAIAGVCLTAGLANAASLTELEDLTPGTVYATRANSSGINDYLATQYSDTGAISGTTADGRRRQVGRLSLIAKRLAADAPRPSSSFYSNSNRRNFDDAFIGFCLQADQYSAPGSSIVTAASSYFSAALYRYVDLLWTNVGADVLAGNRAANAAFQLTLWELTRENAGDYNFDSGKFTAGTNFTYGSGRLARSYLDNLLTGKWTETGRKFSVLKTDNPYDQDVFVPGGPDTPDQPNPVPLPAGLGLLALALGALGVLPARRALR